MNKVSRIIICLILPLCPLGAQFHLDIVPYFWYDSYTAENDETHPTIQQLYDWYDRPPLVNLSLRLENEGLKAYTQIELHPDMMADLVHPAWTNMQLFYEGEFYMDPNFPQLGYMEYSNDFLMASFGRRKISWGPGRDGLGISGMAPFFDHAFLDFRAPGKRGIWNYSYVIITTDHLGTREMTEPDEKAYKTLIAHRFAYHWPRIRLSLMDYNLIWGRVPDLQEVSPLLHYHNIYQSDQNVMSGMALDILLGDHNRAYLEWLIDDYNLSIEPSDGNPGAMGVLLGWQVQLIEDRPCRKDRNGAAYHALKDIPLLKEGGLGLQLEQVWTSRYLYNRDEEGGKFTNPHYYVWRGETESINTFFGAGYGPDRLVERFLLRYDSHPLLAELLFEYQQIGGAGIDGPYDYPYENWLTPGSPVSRQYRTALSCRWFYSHRSNLFGSVSVDFGENRLFQCGLGWRRSLF